MARAIHRSLAIAIREAGKAADLNPTQVSIVAKKVADVADSHTPKQGTFDREMFMALALRPTLPEPGAE